jgi:hypothetical protein
MPPAKPEELAVTRPAPAPHALGPSGAAAAGRRGARPSLESSRVKDTLRFSLRPAQTPPPSAVLAQDCARIPACRSPPAAGCTASTGRSALATLRTNLGAVEREWLVRAGCVGGSGLQTPPGLRHIAALVPWRSPRTPLRAAGEPGRARQCRRVCAMVKDCPKGFVVLAKCRKASTAGVH